MGQAKKRWMELEARHLSHIPEKKICVKHFADKSIANFIRKNYVSGFCDYCKKDLKVVEFEELMEFIMDGVSNFYEDAGNFMSYDSGEGGYLGEIYTPDELIQEQIELEASPFEIIEDVVASIDDVAWAQTDLYYDNISDELEYQWQYFKKIIKHNARYLFNTKNDEQAKAFKILNAVSGLISKSRLIKRMPRNTTIYRCRQHDRKDEISALKQIVSPPDKDAIYSNRFSPAGISMFYSSFDPETALIETVSRNNDPNNIVTIGEFITKHECYIVDFTRLPKIPSIFGIKDKKSYYLKLFLRLFVKDITQRIIKDGMEHIDYVPTQVVTEYLRFPFNKNRKHKIEGIIFPSSQHLNHSSAVFFWDHKSSLEKVELKSLDRR